MTTTIIGVNEDASLTPEAAAALASATLVVGGKRHLALAAPLITGQTLAWPTPMHHAIPQILAHQGPVAILATGDPLWFGAATLLLQHLPNTTRIIPAPSSFQLAAAHLGWTLQHTTCLSCCGRPIEAIIPHLQPGAQLLILSSGPETPQQIESLLTSRKLDHTLLILENLSTPQQRVRKPSPLGRGLGGAVQGSADPFGPWNDGGGEGMATNAPPTKEDPIAPLNLIALTIQGPTAQTLPLTPGRPDPLFENDGQLTKSEIRAITLAALAPRQGERLWDIGTGSGAIAIEWMLAHPMNQAIAIERHPARAARARRNALALGTPALQIIEGEAPEALQNLPPPNAIFLGGSAHRPGLPGLPSLPSLIDTAKAALKPGGRLVANAIALETEAALIAAQSRYGGTLTRIAIERLDHVGTMQAYRPAMTVTQWCLTL